MSRLLALIFAGLLLFPLTGRARRDTRVEFVTTAGNFTVRLLPDTPIHSRHFEQLVRAGYYDGLLFHRVIRDFMVQAGDSTSRQAAPGTRLGEADRKETLPPEFDLPYHYHRRGALAMARESDEVNPGRRSSATQFYIVGAKPSRRLALPPFGHASMRPPVRKVPSQRPWPKNMNTLAAHRISTVNTPCSAKW